MYLAFKRIRKLAFLIVLGFTSFCVQAQNTVNPHKKIEKKPVPDKVEVEGPVFEIFDVSQKAIFPGGEEGLQRFIAENIKYPAIALKNETQGTINVMFVVDRKGNVKDVVILGKKKGDGLDEEAMRVIKLTSGMWKPAMQRDKLVNMRFRIPIKFQLF